MYLRKTYSNLLRYRTFEDRLKYLYLGSHVGDSTFGGHRYLNQLLYRSKEWRELRPKIILRDCGCDLGMKGYEIFANAIIHHINPITIQDILNRNPAIFDPENIITTTDRTHRKIHYGNVDEINSGKLIYKDRYPGDTVLWR